jgi:hypothetical protein
VLRFAASSSALIGVGEIFMRGSNGVAGGVGVGGTGATVGVGFADVSAMRVHSKSSSRPSNAVKCFGTLTLHALTQNDLGRAAVRAVLDTSNQELLKRCEPCIAWCRLESNQ